MKLKEMNYLRWSSIRITIKPITRDIWLFDSDPFAGNRIQKKSYIAISKTPHPPHHPFPHSLYFRLFEFSLNDRVVIKFVKYNSNLW